MSFASETKKELTNLEMKECCEKAELSALLRMNGSLFKPSSINRYSNGKCGNCKKDLYAFEKGYDVTVELLVRKNAIEEKQCIYRKAC